jgi:hypothetical protein
LNAGWLPATDARQELIMGAVWLAMCLRQEILVGIKCHVYFTIGESFNLDYNRDPTGTLHGLGFGLVNGDNDKPYVP